jgi:predicted nucleic acid-binding protein
MNIFLDTNVFYNDPFLLKGKKRILLMLAKYKEVKLYVSRVVYSELLRLHNEFLEKQVKDAKEAFSKLSPFLNNKRDRFDFDFNLDDLMKDFNVIFDIFQIEEQLEIIEYDSDVLKEIVEIDMYKKSPFIRRMENTNKKGDKISYYKKEIRDAIIWYSYRQYIEKNQLSNCYFISNNTKEFASPGNNDNSKNQPYALHPGIGESHNLIAYRTVEEFLFNQDDRVKELFVNLDLHSKILSEELFEKVVEELGSGYAEELINQYFEDEILSETYSFLSKRQPNEIHEDYFMHGYVDPLMFGNIVGIRLNEVEIYGDSITVSVDADVEMEVDIYLYNPVYDDKDEKFQNYATDLIKITENATFLLPVDIEKELDIDGFSLRKYVEGNEPDHLNVEIIEFENVDHTDIVRDEEYEY